MISTSRHTSPTTLSRGGTRPRPLAAEMLGPYSLKPSAPTPIPPPGHADAAVDPAVVLQGGSAGALDAVGAFHLGEQRQQHQPTSWAIGSSGSVESIRIASARLPNPITRSD
jgi:hypothetical protein